MTMTYICLLREEESKRAVVRVGFAALITCNGHVRVPGNWVSPTESACTNFTSPYQPARQTWSHFPRPSNNLPIKGNSISLGIETRYGPLVSEDTLLCLVVWRRKKSPAWHRHAYVRGRITVEELCTGNILLRFYRCRNQPLARWVAPLCPSYRWQRKATGSFHRSRNSLHK